MCEQHMEPWLVIKKVHFIQEYEILSRCFSHLIIYLWCLTAQLRMAIGF